jgi:hypothetical protein
MPLMVGISRDLITTKARQIEWDQGQLEHHQHTASWNVDQGRRPCWTDSLSLASGRSTQVRASQDLHAQSDSIEAKVIFNLVERR